MKKRINKILPRRVGRPTIHGSRTIGRTVCLTADKWAFLLWLGEGLELSTNNTVSQLIDNQNTYHVWLRNQKKVRKK